MYFHESRNVEQMNLSFRPTVVELRAYLAHYGVTVPSRLRKDDLVALADDVRFSDVEVVVHMVDKLGGSIAPVVVTCGNCGAVAVPGYDYCDSCLRSMAAADDAWRAHMNPPVEVAEVETTPCAGDWHDDALCRCRVGGPHTCGPGTCRECESPVEVVPVVDRLPVCDRSVCQQLAEPQAVPVPCEYFALCDNHAIGTTSHPVLGAVPTCQRCADRFDLDVRPF